MWSGKDEHDTNNISTFDRLLKKKYPYENSNHYQTCLDLERHSKALIVCILILCRHVSALPDVRNNLCAAIPNKNSNAVAETTKIRRRQRQERSIKQRLLKNQHPILISRECIGMKTFTVASSKPFVHSHRGHLYRLSSRHAL